MRPASQSLRRAAAGLLQLPVSWLGIRALNGNFTAINVAQIIFLLPIFVFCWMMHRCAAALWQRHPSYCELLSSGNAPGSHAMGSF